MYKKVLLLLLILILSTSAGCVCTSSGGYVYHDCYGDLPPCANATYSIGSPALWWADAYIVDLHAGTITGNVTGPVIVAATLVIAANDSLDTDRADYICDGVADDIQINAAIADLPASSGQIMLLEGSYTTAANIVLPANTTFSGQGKSTTMTAGGAGVTNAIVINGDNVHIRDMKVVIAAGCGVGGARPNVIHAADNSNILLDNLYLYGDKTVGNDGNANRQNGIFFSNVDYSTIVNCEVTNNYWFGAYLRGDSDYNNIESSIFTTNTSSGIMVDTSNDNSISSNLCSGNTEHGIRIKSADSNRIEDNTCALNTRSGIYTLASSENVYANNTLKDNTRYGLQLSGGVYNIVDGNSITGNDIAATGVYSGIYTTANHTTIVGNSFYSNGLHGIYLFRANYCTIDGNVCGQQLDGDGIHVLGDGTVTANYNAIVGNTCYGNGDDGIELAGGTDCNYTVIDGNQLQGNLGTNYVDGGNQSEYWGGSTEAEFELRPELHMAKIAGAGKPTLIDTGVYQGYSLPIWNAGENVDEELYFSICVPQRWCEEHDIEVHIYCCIHQANDTKNFQLELCWEHITVGTDLVPATCNSVPVQTATGAAAAPFQTYQVVFTVDYDIDVGDAILIDDILGLRIRRIDAAANEIAGELIILHAGVVFARDKVGSPIP